ncbi:MAG: imm11 family protein [Myxococcota bacterium]
MADYFAITGAPNDDACAVFDHPESFEKFTWPSLGRELGAEWPEGLEYRMSPDAPGLAIPDVIDNALDYLMVSARAKALLSEHATAPIEWLRFTLLNHKGRVASDDLWIANVLTAIECVDREKTVGKPYPARPEWYFSIRELHLLEDRIDPQANCFRLAERPMVIMVRDDLRSLLESEGITGAAFHPLGEEVRL